MQAPAGPPFFFDPFDEATRRDPYALFARARREHPAWRHEGLPVVSVFRHADCQAILRDPETWSSVFPTPRGFAPEDVPRSMLVMDPPEHTRLRGLVSLAFTPRRIRQLAPRIEAIAHELLAAALARREVDLVEALTYPLPVVVIAELIGVPAEDRARFKVWSDAIVAPLGTVFFEVAPPERVATLRRVRGELEAYFVRLGEARGRAPRGDLLSALGASGSRTWPSASGRTTASGRRSRPWRQRWRSGCCSSARDASGVWTTRRCPFLRASSSAASRACPWCWSPRSDGGTT